MQPKIVNAIFRGIWIIIGLGAFLVSSQILLNELLNGKLPHNLDRLILMGIGMVAVSVIYYFVHADEIITTTNNYKKWSRILAVIIEIVILLIAIIFNYTILVVSLPLLIALVFLVYKVLRFK